MRAHLALLETFALLTVPVAAHARENWSAPTKAALGQPAADAPQVGTTRVKRAAQKRASRAGSAIWGSDYLLPSSGTLLALLAGSGAVASAKDGRATAASAPVSPE